MLKLCDVAVPLAVKHPWKMNKAVVSPAAFRTELDDRHGEEISIDSLVSFQI